MQNGNRFKLGLFGMNCSGSVPTAVPERWKAGWPETREAARLADAAGLEFLLPIARWLGYGGATDRQGTSCGGSSRTYFVLTNGYFAARPALH